MLASTSRGALRRSGLGVRAEVGRLPRAGPRDLRRHGAAQPQRARPDAGLPGPAATCAGALLCQEAVLDGEVVVLGARRAGPTSTPSRTGAARSPTWSSTCCTWTGSGSADLPWGERRARLAADRRARGAAAPDAQRPRRRARARDLFARPPRPGASRASSPSAWTRPTGPAGGCADWRKVKTRHEVVVVIGGFTEGDGSRRGHRSGRCWWASSTTRGRLTYLSHVGSGLSDAARPGALGPPARRRRCAESPFAEPGARRPRPRRTGCGPS